MTDSQNQINNPLPKAKEEWDEKGFFWHECPGCKMPDETGGPKGYAGEIFKCPGCDTKYEVVK